MKINRMGFSLIGWIVALCIAPSISFAQNSLESADTALRYGDYQTAIIEYSTATNQSALRCDALYGLGTTYLRDFQYNESINTLSQYINECDNTFTAHILRAQALQQLGDADSALADYQQAITLRPQVLDSYLYEQMALLNPDQGILYLRLASEAPRNIQSKLALREKLADAYLLIGSVENVITQYDLILNEIDAYRATLNTIENVQYDNSGAFRARIDYAASQIEIDNGQLQAGYVRLQRIITNYPETNSALPALIDLVVAGQPVDLLIRMRINVLNENYFPVVDVLVNYLNNPDNVAAAPTELFLLLGRAQRGRGETDSALVTFNRVVTEFPQMPEASTALLEIGNTYRELSNTEQALQAFRTLISTYPTSAELPDVLLALASLERNNGNLSAAMDIYRTLAQNFAESEAIQETLFDVALSLSTQDPPTSAELFGLIGTSRGYVWQGRVLQQLGDSAGATQARQQATGADSGTFFAMQACAQLSNTDLFAPVESPQITPLTPTDIAEIENWVAQSFGIETVSATLSPELANNPMLQRGIALWEVGLWSQARAEFDALQTLNRDNPQALLQLALDYQSMSIYRSSLFSATRLVFASEQPFTQIPRGLLQLAYPVYFEGVLTSQADAYDLDLLLVASLMRQESSFDPTAQSFVGATGLMQLMPATAQDTASRIGVTDFVLTDLVRPIVNVEFGSFYLDSMLAFQGESVSGALLSYNAGPGNALSWVQAAGDDLPLLYETITFAESRLYLELITENYMIYKYIYGVSVPNCMFEGASTVNQ